MWQPVWARREVTGPCPRRTALSRLYLLQLEEKDTPTARERRLAARRACLCVCAFWRGYS